ncbi:MAG: hypothetical protein E7A63_03670 [Clostridium butyricum]|nr:hypothetical protein [Clostridium butyricum]
MKKIVFNDGELRDNGINFNVFCLMQLDAEEQEEKLELCTRNMKSYIYGSILGRKDIYNIFDQCGYVKQKSTTLRREHRENNGVSATYTYLSFEFSGRKIVEVDEERLLNLIRKNNPKLTKLYIFLFMETSKTPKLISQKQILKSIGLSPRSEGILKKMTDVLVNENFIKVNRYRDVRGINRIEYKAK